MNMMNMKTFYGASNSTHESKSERNTLFLFENPDLLEVIDWQQAMKKMMKCQLVWQVYHLKRNLQIQKDEKEPREEGKVI